MIHAAAGAITMDPRWARQSLLLLLLACSALLLVFPVSPVLSSEVIFDDEVVQRVNADSMDNRHSQLVLMISHDDGARLTNNLSRVQSLMQLEQEAWDGSNPATSWEAEHIIFERIETPFAIWSEAFASRNRSLENATQWADVLQPTMEDGWCGLNSTNEEKAAFQATILFLPDEANFNLACPAFPGASADQAPEANELLWIIWLDSGDGDMDWAQLKIWAEKISESTEFQVTPVGANMLFSEARQIAENDLQVFMLPAVVLLGAILVIGLRDPLVVAATLAGTGLVVFAEMGALSALGYTFSVLDGIALPIIMGVAVDGAFWYCRSSREKEQVRSMLFIAMLTTVAAVSLAIFSPVKAQKTLAFVIVVGILLDWLVTRFILEEFYLRRRTKIEFTSHDRPLTQDARAAWSWPALLLVLAAIVLVSPSGVEVLDFNQVLPEDHPEIDKMEDLQSKYMLASSSVAWIVIDVEGDSTEDLLKVQDLQRQLGQHPSVITYDTGMTLSPMVLGVPFHDSDTEGATIDGLSATEIGSILVRDTRLQRDGVTTGVAIAALVEIRNPNAVLLFAEDVEGLLAQNELSGGVGGDLVTGATLAKAFDEARVGQILAAGIAVFFVAMFVLRSKSRAARIAIGAVAIGAAVDGLASMVGGRGVHTAPVVLLGMGFAADYLSHASSDHPPTRSDTSARWGAALTSVSVFVLLGFAEFPPAKYTGQLLGISIILSVLLATALSLTHVKRPNSDCEE